MFKSPQESSKGTVGTVVEELLDEFSEELRLQTAPEVDAYLERCPDEEKSELLSLINTEILAERALSYLRANVAEDRSEEGESG